MKVQATLGGYGLAYRRSRRADGPYVSIYVEIGGEWHRLGEPRPAESVSPAETLQAIKQLEEKLRAVE